MTLSNRHSDMLDNYTLDRALQLVSHDILRHHDYQSEAGNKQAGEYLFQYAFEWGERMEWMLII